MNSRLSGAKTEQLEWDFKNVNQSIKVDYAFGGNGSFDYWKGVVKSDLMNIVGGNGENIPRYKLVETVRADIGNALHNRGLEVEFRKDAIVITQAPQDRSGEYEESYRPRA
jgi:hypothetical protein